VRAANGIWAGHRDLLLQAYAAYNAQDVEALLARISDDVDWPDGAGRRHGKEQVRAYWTRAVDPNAHARRAAELQ
jgi:ketosteroid isomerase-like protein